MLPLFYTIFLGLSPSLNYYIISDYLDKYNASNFDFELSIIIGDLLSFLFGICDNPFINIGDAIVLIGDILFLVFICN